VLSILSELTKGGRLQIGWTGPADLARREVKLAFLLIQCLETAMPWGGQIAVTIDGPRCTVTGTAPRLRIDPALWETLSNPHAPAEITPALVHFALVPAEVQTQARRLTVEVGPTEIRMAF
jgi:histidine phosphotransferase ChpT